MTLDCVRTASVVPWGSDLLIVSSKCYSHCGGGITGATLVLGEYQGKGMSPFLYFCDTMFYRASGLPPVQFNENL